MRPEIMIRERVDVALLIRYVVPHRFRAGADLEVGVN